LSEREKALSSPVYKPKKETKAEIQFWLALSIGPSSESGASDS
jgi:hypothetical protein